jgi:hypothetical protein
MYEIQDIESNTLIIQYIDDKSGIPIDDIFGTVTVNLAAYIKGKLIYTSDDLGSTQFITKDGGYGYVSVTNPIFSNEKTVQIFADIYGKKYDLGLRLTISSETNDQYKSSVQVLDVIEPKWHSRPFKFPAIDWAKETGAFRLFELKGRVSDVKELASKLKDYESIYLKLKAEYDAEIKGNVDLKLDRSNEWEPATFKNVLTRILEFQTGTLLPAIEYCKVAGLDVIQGRLKIIQDLFVVILNEYPKITIEDGEGRPYHGGSAGEWTLFTHSAYGSEVDEIAVDIALARGEIRGLYNPYFENGWNTLKDGVKPDDRFKSSPTYTLWNAEGGDPYATQTGTFYDQRNYTSFQEALQGSIGENILIKPLIMYDAMNNDYYQFIFITWGQDDGGSFSYLRRKLVNQ